MYKKIFIVFLIVLIIGISLTGILSMEVSKSVYLSNIETRLKDDAHLVAEYVYGENLVSENISVDNIELIAKNTNNRITIINLDGNVLYDSHKNIDAMDNHRTRIEVKKALMGEEDSIIRYSDTLEEDMMYYAIPIIKNEKIIGATRLSIPLHELNLIYSKLIKNIIIASIIGIIISSIIAYIYIYYVTKPIKELTLQAKELAKGNFENTIKNNSKDELGELAQSFNEMAIKLKVSIEELKIQNTKFETVLDSMKDGIIAVDLNKNIMLMNPSAKELFHIKEEEIVVGKNILTFIRNVKLYNELENISNNNMENSIEIQIDYPKKRILKIYSNPIRYLAKDERISGVVIVIRDLTELRKLENIRKDFVANVSHELKSPVTSIKGFVETLRSGGVEDENTRDKFLEIIYYESERLIRLVEDILMLSNLENSKSPHNVKKIIIKETLQEIVQMVQQLADKKNINISTKISTDLPPISFNIDQFKQMLINIIDNAIKYTPEDGAIDIIAKRQENNIVIEIRDNGIGIPKEDIPRLFERFYRVDKGRSRTDGGTGLGLAIVKHILQSMNGKIRLESELGKGTSFILYIPIK
jgi:two-component system phosphate regulon sensor histidine kinase PhoR